MILLFIHSCHSCLPITERHNSPLPTPGPLARAGIAASPGRLAQTLVFARRQADDDVRFAGPEGEDADAGFGAEGADGGREGGGWVPCGL